MTWDAVGIIGAFLAAMFGMAAFIRAGNTSVKQELGERLNQVDARFDRMEADTNARFDKMEADANARFDKVDAALSGIDGRLRTVEIQMGQVRTVLAKDLPPDTKLALPA